MGAYGVAIMTGILISKNYHNKTWEIGHIFDVVLNTKIFMI